MLDFKMISRSYFARRENGEVTYKWKKTKVGNFAVVVARGRYMMTYNSLAQVVALLTSIHTT